MDNGKPSRCRTPVFCLAGGIERVAESLLFPDRERLTLGRPLLSHALEFFRFLLSDETSATRTFGLALRSCLLALCFGLELGAFLDRSLSGVVALRFVNRHG
jgi:hypothetical protein